MEFQAGPTTPIREPSAPRERAAAARPQPAPERPDVSPDPALERPTPQHRPEPESPAETDLLAVPERPLRPVAAPRPVRSGPVDPVVVGRRFQPVPGGALPRPHPSDPLMAALLATPAAPVFAVTAGTVRRAPAQITAGAVELHAPDGSAFVLLGGSTVAWVVDDEEPVVAGAVLGIVAGSPGDPPGEPLLVLAIDSSGTQVDAVALLVGLPDPGELDLLGSDPAAGVDPYRLDLELAASLSSTGEAS
ncbi:hypothetical protein ASD16_05885 [Cellulomonas sp. Root485]|uniref:hypothetical protein n=1 Tax=Cellulomonas sp. Root485 TaxID=1736546 RepID=UPI0006FF973C|nr:hypothetical protein [Cellulomonas sp. Root485]KQY24990.1 hypothetical protein ASD16_05885 [Cellulomonas sp. Root485]